MKYVILWLTYREGRPHSHSREKWTALTERSKYQNNSTKR